VLIGVLAVVERFQKMVEQARDTADALAGPGVGLPGDISLPKVTPLPDVTHPALRELSYSIGETRRRLDEFVLRHELGEIIVPWTIVPGVYGERDEEKIPDCQRAGTEWVKRYATALMDVDAELSRKPGVAVTPAFAAAVTSAIQLLDEQPGGELLAGRLLYDRSLASTLRAVGQALAAIESASGSRTKR